MKLTNFLNKFLSNHKNYFPKPLRLLGNNVNAVDCSSVLGVTCPCCFVCVCFCDSFICSISLLLVSDSLSYILYSVL